MDVKTELTKPRNKHSEHKNIKAFEVRIIRDIKNLFEQDYYKPLKVSNLKKKKTVLNMKVMMKDIKPYQSKNNWMKLNHTCKT